MTQVQRCRAVVLAGERPGGNEISRTTGLATSVLAEVAGRSCIERVVNTLRDSGVIDGGLLVGPDVSAPASARAVQELTAPGDFTWLQPAAGPSASALAALDQLNRFPVLLTTGDHALLTSAVVESFCRRAMTSSADFVIGLVPYKKVHERWPASRRTRLKFNDGACCGANLFLANSPRARRVLEFWRGIENARKHPWRIARYIGPATLLRYAARRLDRAGALKNLSLRIGADIEAILIDDPRAAVDVDTLADLALAEEILKHG